MAASECSTGSRVALAALAKLERRQALITDEWQGAREADPKKANIVFGILAEVTEKVATATTVVESIKHRLADVPTEPPTDDTLDIYSHIAHAVRDGTLRT